MRISDWSSDVCSSDLPDAGHDVADQVAAAHVDLRHDLLQRQRFALESAPDLFPRFGVVVVDAGIGDIADQAAVAMQPLGQFHVLEIGRASWRESTGTYV